MYIKKIIVLGIFVWCACSSKHKSSYETRNSLFQTSIGVNVEHYLDSTNQFVDSVIEALDKSNDSIAFLLLTKKFKTEIDYYNGYSSLIPSLEENDNLSLYLTYRYNEYIGDVEKERLYFNLAGNNHIYHFNNNGNDSTIRKLKEIEEDYLLFSIDSNRRSKYLESIKMKLEKYPNSNRLKYLYANMNFDVNRFNICLPIFNELLKSDYYSYKILRRLIGYYQYINLDSSMFYSRTFDNRFNYRCAIEKLNIENSSKFISNCDKCLSGKSRRDSITAKVVLARYYLQRRDFKKITNIFNDYKKTNNHFELDNLKIWETGEYYDIMLQSFFLRKQYNRFCEFVFEEMGYNQKIHVVNETDFKNLVKKYYFKYKYDQTGDMFVDFYNKNFLFYLRNKFSNFSQGIQ